MREVMEDDTTAIDTAEVELQSSIVCFLLYMLFVYHSGPRI
jgi:hypothetical protein